MQKANETIHKLYLNNYMVSKIVQHDCTPPAANIKANRFPMHD